MLAVHAFSENQTDELNFNYSFLVQSNSKVKIWQLTFKSCFCMFFKETRTQNMWLWVIWQTQVNFQIFGLVRILRLKSNCSLSKAVSEGKKSYIYSICNHPFYKQSYFKNHVVAVHAFSENQTDELIFHYRSLVQSNSKMKIWLLTFKCCLCMFFKIDKTKDLMWKFTCVCQITQKPCFFGSRVLKNTYTNRFWKWAVRFSP